MSTESSVCVDREDRFMVAAARLVFDLSLPTEIQGSGSLSSPDRNIVWLRKLYEKGIAEFYDVVLSGVGWVVRAGKSIDETVIIQGHAIRFATVDLNAEMSEIRSRLEMLAGRPHLQRFA